MTAFFHSSLTCARTHQTKALPLKKKRARLQCRSHFFANTNNHDDQGLAEVDNTTTKVRFSPIVSVVQIPNRFDYTESDRANIWISAEDQVRDRQRNTVEFAYENRDWLQVVEEDEFFLIREEWIHPVHVQNAIRRLQLRLASAEVANQSVGQIDC